MAPLSPEDDYDGSVKGWEWRETDQGVPYYVSESLRTSSWDHPYYTKIVEELGQFQEVHYAAYRTALKVRHLQRRFGLHLLSLQCLQTILENHGFPTRSTALIDCQSLQLVLLDMLHSSDFRHFDAYRQDVASELLLNYLLNLFDPERSGVMPVRSVKLTLAALSNATLSEKYQYFFGEAQSGRGYISKEQLYRLVHDLIQIPDLLRESVAFGKNVAAAVNSCIEVAGLLEDGIPEKGFYKWMMREPQTFIWLPTLHRLTASETVKHECKCSVCKMVPIVGFRYKCLQCLKFNMCQECFFKGKVAKNHQLRHPMQEYCLPASAKDGTKAFMKIMRNKLGRRYRQGGKVTYLPVDGRGDQGLLEWEMRPIPPPPSPQREPPAAADLVADPGSRSGSLDSGHSSESGGDGSDVKQAPPSPLSGSNYDNSSSPARYLEERQPQKSGLLLPQEKNSLIHLVHRLRKENRLLRQQLRAGRCSPEDRDVWTSHATAEVVIEPIPTHITDLTEPLSTPCADNTSVTEATQTDADCIQAEDQLEEEQSVLSRTISPISDASVTVNTQRYTSDFFNSILGATANGTPSVQATPRGMMMNRTPGTVLASTPADHRTPAPPTILKTGPRKPPRLTGGFERQTSVPESPDDTITVAETTFQADTAEGKKATVTTNTESKSDEQTADAAEEEDDDDESPFAGSGSATVKRKESFTERTPSTETGNGVKMEKKSVGGGYGQTPLSSHSAKHHVVFERRLMNPRVPGVTGFVNSTGGTVNCMHKGVDESSGNVTKGSGPKLSAPIASPTKDFPDTFSATPDAKARRMSTGNLNDTDTSTPPMFGLFGTPDSMTFHGSLDALRSFDFNTPGGNKSTFAVSRGDSCLLTPERKEIDAMIQWIDAAFPSDLSYSALSLCHTESTSQGRMLKAAESIGHAMADLVQATADSCYM